MAAKEENRPASRALLDDFYAECDEHLLELHRALGRLEPCIGPSPLERAVLDPLFRTVHSLKGILGMAGLAAAEQLAHATEEYLRALSRGETELTEEGLDTLAAAIRAWEQMVAAHRQGEPPPDAASLVNRVLSLLHGAAGPGGAAEPEPGRARLLSAEVQARIKAAVAAGKRVWRCTFSPAPELNERGININTVRARLQNSGALLQSVPQVAEGGKIQFEFLIAADREPLDFARWAGIELQPFDTAAAEAQGQESAVAPEAASSTKPGSALVAPSHIVRVDLGRLDDLMQIMGEMVVQRSRLDETVARVTGNLSTAEARALQEVNQGLARQLRRLREGLMRVRLVPVAEAFERMALVVRDLARESGRKVRLTTIGQETQIDKYVVERLKDPLLHLVRNAVAHGGQTAAERASEGKAAELNITLRAATLGQWVLVEVTDDGAGIDLTKVRERARSAGFDLRDDAGNLLDVLCHAGFSTLDEANLGAGRGVGMGAVKNTVTELGGSLTVRTERGEGTSFTMRLPLTLATADALIISVGGQKFALPQTALQEIASVPPEGIQRLERSEFMSYRNGFLPVIRLGALFGLGEEARPERPVLVVGHGAARMGMVADRLLGQREIVVRPFSDPQLRVGGISGATELGNGEAVLIIDAAAVMDGAKVGIHPIVSAGVPGKLGTAGNG